MTYLVHINPRPGSDERTVEVEGDSISVQNGALSVLRNKSTGDSFIIPEDIAAFAPGIWNYVCPSTTSKPS